MTNNQAIILLSGGLDSLASLALAAKSYNVTLALTFDYGQKAFPKELKAAKTIAEFYNIKHKIIKLDWLKDLSETEIPELKESDLNNQKLMKESSAKVWIPNRNALFINIAAAYADTKSSNYKYIIIGANHEEAETFSDNSKAFIDAINQSLQFSTNSKVQVLAPLIDKNKEDIIKITLNEKAPIKLLYSCYRGEEKHCGKCESCLRLQRAVSMLQHNVKSELIKYFF